MRILHILDHSLPLHSGYTFRTRAILKAQIAQRWSVAGVTGVRQHGEAAGNIEVVDGLTFFRTPPIRGLPSPLREVQEVRALSESVERAIRAFNPNVLHAHSPVLNALAASRVARSWNLPLVYEIRAFWEDAAVGNGTGREGSIKYSVTRALESRAVRKADAVAVICEGLRRDLVTRGVAPGKIVVPPNGVDMKMFGTPLPRDEALAKACGLEGAEVVGFIGSFYDYEGIDDLIAAMALIAAERPRAHLLLVGGGPMEAHLRQQAERSPVAERIHFIGRVPHDAVPRYYSLIDVLAYPRRAMRLTDLVTPLKPLEAMAQGKLVVASDVGGHRELIEDGVTGSLHRAGDVQSLAKAVTMLFSDRSGWGERLATARAFVERERNWSSNISCYEPVYRKLIAARKAVR